MVHDDFMEIDEKYEILMEGKQRRELSVIGRRMYARGMVVAAEGNLSVRLNAHHILVTPAGRCKGRLTPKEMVS